MQLKESMFLTKAKGKHVEQGKNINPVVQDQVKRIS